MPETARTEALNNVAKALNGLPAFLTEQQNWLDDHIRGAHGQYEQFKAESKIRRWQTVGALLVIMLTIGGVLGIFVVSNRSSTRTLREQVMVTQRQLKILQSATGSTATKEQQDQLDLFAQREECAREAVAQQTVNAVASIEQKPTTVVFDSVACAAALKAAADKLAVDIQELQRELQASSDAVTTTTTTPPKKKKVGITSTTVTSTTVTTRQALSTSPSTTAPRRPSPPSPAPSTTTTTSCLGSLATIPVSVPKPC